MTKDFPRHLFIVNIIISIVTFILSYLVIHGYGGDFTVSMLYAVLAANFSMNYCAFLQVKKQSRQSKQS